MNTRLTGIALIFVLVAGCTLEPSQLQPAPPVYQLKANYGTVTIARDYVPGRQASGADTILQEGESRARNTCSGWGFAGIQAPEIYSTVCLQQYCHQYGCVCHKEQVTVDIQCIMPIN